MLRYSNRSIFSEGEYFPLAIGINPKNFSDVEQAIPALQKLLRDLKYEAASGGPLRKYATGEAMLESETIYALVQCTPNLESNQSTDCLDTINESVPTTLAEGKSGLRALGLAVTLGMRRTVSINLRLMHHHHHHLHLHPLQLIFLIPHHPLAQLETV